MKEEPFVPPPGAFTRTVAIRFSHCDPAGIVYFPNYFDMFNGLIEDWYTEQLGVDYSKLILNEHFGFPFVHIETDFKIPSRMGRAPRSHAAADADRTLVIERRHRGASGRRRAIARAPGHRDDVVGDATRDRIAAGVAR